MAAVAPGVGSGKVPIGRIHSSGSLGSGALGSGALGSGPLVSGPLLSGPLGSGTLASRPGTGAFTWSQPSPAQPAVPVAHARAIGSQPLPLAQLASPQIHHRGLASPPPTQGRSASAGPGPSKGSSAAAGRTVSFLPTPSRSSGPQSGRSTTSGGGGSHLASPARVPPSPGNVGDDDPEMRAIYSKIDANGDGEVCKLDFITAMQRDPEVDNFVLPGFDSSNLLSDERCFDAVDSKFDAIARGKVVIGYEDFAAHFRKKLDPKTPKSRELQEIFDIIDKDGSGSISKLEFMAALQQDSRVEDFAMPGVDCSRVMSDGERFAAVDALFEAIAQGKKRIEHQDFQRYFRKPATARSRPYTSSKDRASRRVFIIGPGFGRELNPRQGQLVHEAGYQVHWCCNVPNPEQPGCLLSAHLHQLAAEVAGFRPDVVACASKGGAYLVGLWELGAWRGPSVLINAHPSCKRLPKGANVVLAHGSNDEYYPACREELERLVASGDENRCFLYYSASSGELSPGVLTRSGDRHNMESLLLNDCLPRLLDSAIAPEGPEAHMVRTWRQRLSSRRLEAEDWLGLVPSQLCQRWQPSDRFFVAGADAAQLCEVEPTGSEFQMVSAVFRATPRESPAYLLHPPEVWKQVRVIKVERIQNRTQVDGNATPYFNTLRNALEDQGVAFDPGTHTCWGFHGAQRDAVESIITNPVAGFQPLATGTRGAALWGSGTYFARDAQYVADSHFCGPPAADGTRQMLMCLLLPGMPCLGDPGHRGVLPFRVKPHRYNSSVDSLSSPEIFIVQHPGAAYPAYLITFA